MMQEPAVEKRFYTPDDAARALAISRTSIFQLMKHGKMQFVEIYGMRRIPVAEVDRISNEGVSKPPKPPKNRVGE